MIYQAPEGFTFEPNNGLYFHMTTGINPETGESGQWVTWFYPQSGEYQQVFHATVQPAPVAATTQIPSSQPASFVPHKKGRFNPLMIVLPLLTLIIGLGLSFVLSYSKSEIPDGIIISKLTVESMPEMKPYHDNVSDESSELPIPDGYAVYEWDHYRYEGEWKNGMPNGWGTVTDLKDYGENNLNTTTGNFSNGLAHGEITYVMYWENDRTETFVFEANMGKAIADEIYSHESQMAIFTPGVIWGMQPWVQDVSPWDTSMGTTGGSIVTDVQDISVIPEEQGTPAEPALPESEY